MIPTHIRFWSKVELCGPYECWPWKAYCDRQGYGQYQFGTKREKAHRVAYEYMAGEIPEGMCVLHHCDNPSCVNFKHLWIGTQDDNMKDAVRKGRKDGRGGPRPKFIEEEAKQIRDVLTLKETTISVLAERYGVSTRTIKRVLYKEGVYK